MKLPIKKSLKHKYHAQRTEIDNINFASKKEANYYGKLKILQNAGEILFFLCQVPFHLPGKITYRIDFMEFWKNGDIRFTDVKGMRTQIYIMKKKLVEANYPIIIQEI